MRINTKFMIDTFFASLGGIPVTLEITLVTLLISSPLAFLMALSRQRKKGIGNKLVIAYVSFIRGTPVVLQILFLYSLLPSLLNHLFNNVLELDIDVFGWNTIIYAFVVFSLNTTAVLSEVFRSALSTVEHGQMEAALSVGLSRRQAYARIIVPQALVSAIPNICNATVNLLKSTSLAFMMTVQDITAIAKVRAAYGYNYIEAYLVVFFIYILLCTLVQLLFKAVERYLSSYKKLITA